MTSYDELLGINESENSAQGKVVEVPLDELHPFKKHPFHVNDDEEMDDLVESIRQHGVLNPGIVRPKPEGGYEIISGHRRKRGSELAGLSTLPVLVTGEDMEEAMVQGSKEKEVQESADNGKMQEELPPEDAPERMEVDWTGLKAVNLDVVAWIQLPAIDMSYPVVQGDDNSYYMHRSITKEELFSGCLFMDAYNDPALQNFNTIIYGHNMRDGSMFAKLKEYDNAETWTVCPYFWIYTEQGEHLYRIFSSHKAEVNGSTFTVRFSDIMSYVSWLQKMKENSSVASELNLAYGDKVVTLSTCTSGGGVRQILQGVLVYQSW